MGRSDFHVTRLNIDGILNATFGKNVGDKSGGGGP